MSVFYLDVSLELNTSKLLHINANNFISHVMQSMKILFGEVGSSVKVDLLNYQASKKRGILRVPEDYFVRLYSSLTLNGLFEDIECAYRVHKTTRNPLDLNLDIVSDSE